LQDVVREFEAQVEKAMDCGIRIDKLDSHMHIHLLPGIFQVVLAVARRYRIRWIRLPKAYALEASDLGAVAVSGKQLVLTALSHFHKWRVARSGILSPDRFAGLAESGRLTEESLVRIVQRLRPGVTEVMVHPGYLESLSDAWPQSRRYQRQEELTALTSARVKDLINLLGIKLINYCEADQHL
jgi:predicted glycoside hydrolase/deacetylase ChbG (UPF0249 family)